MSCRFRLGIELSVAAVIMTTVLALLSSPHIRLAQASQPACHEADSSEVRVAGGTFMMGAARTPMDEDVIMRKVAVGGFSMDKFAVANAQFAAFVDATGYVTDAERPPDPADYPGVPPEKLVPGAAVFTPPAEDPGTHNELAWWTFVPGANWRHPAGPDSAIKGKDNYPVVQVSYNDALAYAKWKGRTLPTEEQFEYAARGGLDGKTYAWGDERTPGGRNMANTWQGHFPVQDSAEDGYAHMAPVGCFPPNGYGLYDMIGNTWEWTQSAVPQDPYGQSAGTNRIIKGGSFLCSENFCMRYRPAARQFLESDFSSMHVGFRTISRSP